MANDRFEKKFRWDNIIIYLLLIIAIATGFFGPENEVYLNWETAAIFVTLVYTFAIYIIGFFFNGFQSIDKHWKIGLVSTLLILIGLLTTPFTFSILRHFDANFSGKIYTMFIEGITRTTKMLYLFISILIFCLIDWLMIKWKNDEINYHINLRYSDFPIAISFFVLWIYSIYLGNSNIEIKKLESFFSGAIALQILVSNLIWTYNDDLFFKKLKGE
jgi:hypothetical protein